MRAIDRRGNKTPGKTLLPLFKYWVFYANSKNASSFVECRRANAYLKSSQIVELNVNQLYTPIAALDPTAVIFIRISVTISTELFTFSGVFFFFFFFFNFFSDCCLPGDVHNICRLCSRSSDMGKHRCSGRRGMYQKLAKGKLENGDQRI